jgi:hypothetical protein
MAFLKKFGRRSYGGRQRSLRKFIPHILFRMPYACSLSPRRNDNAMDSLKGSADKTQYKSFFTKQLCEIS